MRKIVNAGSVTVLLLAGLTTPGFAKTSRPIVRHVPHKQLGKASIYATSLQGRHMTNGERFNVNSTAAASKTLPIGTKARVTNLETGKSAEVTIKDRGPVPRGRVVDLTPHTARQIGLTRKEGIAPVAVVPTSLPATTATASNAAVARP